MFMVTWICLFRQCTKLDQGCTGSYWGPTRDGSYAFTSPVSEVTIEAYTVFATFYKWMM